MGKAEAQTRALIGGFGSKERFEYFRQGLFRNTFSGIRYFNWASVLFVHLTISPSSSGIGLDKLTLVVYTMSIFQLCEDAYYAIR